MSRITDIWAKVSQVVATLKLFRVHIFITSILFLLFFVPQTQDIALAIHTDDNLMQLVLALFLAFGVLPLAMWYSGRWLTLNINGNFNLNINNGHERYLNFLLKWIPRLAGISPCLAFSFSLWTVDSQLRCTAILGTVAAAAWLLFFVFRTKVSFKNFGDIGDKFLFFNIYVQMMMLAVIFTSWILVWYLPVQFPQTLGTIAAVLVFFSVFVLICTYLAWVYEFSGVPVMLLGFILTIVFAQFNLTDNHKIETVINTEAPHDQLLLEHAFQDWLKARQDKWDIENSDNPYPIFVVAAEGGGIFAMQNAAFSLSILEDLTQPRQEQPSKQPFSQHTFAISTISGGSLGAGIFVASLVDPDSGIQSGQRLSVLRKVVTKDFLSPIAANLFSLDFVQRFWPFSDLPDRNSAFRNAIHASWEEHISNQSREFLNNPFSQFWTGKNLPPYLVLNSVEINSGRMVAAAPFRFQRHRKDNINPCYITPDIIAQDRQERLTFREVLSPNTNDFDRNSKLNLVDDKDCKTPLTGLPVEPYEELTFIEAATTSARFPYVSPTGYLERFVDQNENGVPWSVRAQYVDGGYLEGSGVEPALIMVERLNRWIETASRSTKADRLFRDLDKKIKIHLVSIELEKPDAISDSNLGTILAPPLGLLATWGVRSNFAIENAVNYFRERGDASTFQRIQADDSANEIPLGWHLSKQTSDKLLTKLFERKAGSQFDSDKPADVFCKIAQLMGQNAGLNECYQNLENIKKGILD